MRDQPPAVFTEGPQATAPREFDPLQLCIYTTVGVIAWLITPPLTVAIFGTVGVVGYVNARRNGLAKSRCKLGDTRLVIAYLAVAALAGWVVTAVNIANWVG